MKNTLKIALLVIGIGMMGFGVYTFFFGWAAPATSHELVQSADSHKQSLAMLAFGALCLISGLGFRRR